MPTGDEQLLATPGRTTLLMYACSQGDLAQVKHILHAQPNSAVHRDRTLKTALHYCAGGGGEQTSAGLAHCADLLVMAAPGLVETRDEDGFTPLHLAVISGNMQLVTFLLANGADVNSLDAEKHSVVHWATVCGETAALGAVLSVGAHVSTPDVHGGFPLHYAAQMCGSEKDQLGLQVLHILLTQPGVTVAVEDNDGRQPLLWAASAGSARAVLALVRAGAAVEAPDRDGLTALHCAASRGHTDCLDTLLTLCGATPDVIDSNGCTALHYSVTLGHADATALLLSHGADPNRQDRKGRSPAHCGCAKGQLETVKQLGTHGANLWLRNARGDLPLHEAAASGRRQLVRWLLDQRPSQVNARNNDGRCPLHLAALNDNADMCKILLDAGAQVNPVLRTSKNVFMTPLDCALQRGFRSTAKFLQLHGGIPASRLSSVRLGSDQTLNKSSASNRNVRDDVTVKASSSSESELEDVHKKDLKPRRRTVRRRHAQRYDKKREQSGSGSEADEDTHVRTKRDKSTASVKNIDDKTNDPGKIARKHDKENDTKVKASRDVDVLREDGDGRTVKQIELKSDGKQFRKKHHGTGSVSETDPNSSGSQVESNGKFTKAPNDKSIQCKPKTRSAASQKENFLDDEHQKQKCEENGSNISDPGVRDSIKERESTLGNGDIPSKKCSVEESHEQQKKSSIEKEDLANKEMEPELEKDKQAEVQNDLEEKVAADAVETKQESQINDTAVEENEEASKKISNGNLKKKKSLDSERKNTKSVESEKTPVDKVGKLLSVNSEEGRKRLKKQQSMHEPAEDDAKVMKNLSNGEQIKKKSSKSDSASSTKQKEKSASAKSRKDSAKSTVDKTETEQADSEAIAEKVEEPLRQQESKPMDQEDTKSLEGTETEKQADEVIETSEKTLQPDQISLQSKMSEESPSKTIVVQAAVHPPPKGVEEKEDTTGEPSEQPSEELQDATEVSPTLEESKQEAETQLAEEDKPEEDKSAKVVDHGKEATEDKEADANSPENEDEKKEDEDLSEEEKVTTEDTKTQPTVISVDDSTTATEIKSQEVLPLNGESLPVEESKDLTANGEPGVTTEVKNEEVDKPSTETKVDNRAETKEMPDKAADKHEDKEISKENGAIQEEQVKELGNGAIQEEQVKELGNRAETLDKTEELPEDSEEMNKEEQKIGQEVEGDVPAIEQGKKNDTKAKPTELNIDLSLKKFEETASLQEGVVTDIAEKDTKQTLRESGKTVEEIKQKKYRKKKSSKSKTDKTDDTQTSEDAKTQQTIISELPTDIKTAEKDQSSSSTSRETSSSETDSEKSVRKLKSQDDKKGDHKSFKVLKDVAFEVLKDGKEQRRIKRKSSKKSVKELERPNESATSSPEMLESSRTRSKSLTREPRSSLEMHGITLPVLSESKLRPDSNLSAPNLSSVYSDNEHKSASNSEVDDIVSSASRKRRFKKRAKMRIGSKSAGSDYESSNLIDSGFEPSPRSSRIPKRKVMSERGVNMVSVTQNIQSNIRRYHMERKIFQHLLDLKRLQIRSGQANENLLVKRAIDNYHNSVAASVGAGRYMKKDYSYKSFEQFLYQSLRMLQKSPADHLKGLPETSETADNPLLCTQSTHRCLHAMHAYTGVPCAAYIPKMNHHTMPKIGFTPRSSAASFLPQINSKAKSVTLELCHGNDKQVISLPADRLDHNKRYYVTFTVKGQDAQSPTTDQDTATHQHAKSV